MILHCGLHFPVLRCPQNLERKWRNIVSKITTQGSPKRIAILTVIDNVVSALEAHKYRTDPILGELNRAVCPESGDCFMDVALFMHACSMLVGLAGLEWKGHSANAADDALS
jgi:hypothetical protein